jgi:enoyl-CoA hydratase
MSSIRLDTYEHVRLAADDRGVLTATITNPERRNAVNAGIAADLDRLWRDIDADLDVRVVVLQGEGDAFCAGADFSYLEGQAPTGRTLRRHKAVAKGVRDRVFDIIDCETPTIAKVRGPAYGMGVNIALACDFVIAAEDARFCDSHVRNALTAGDGGVAFFPLMVGFRRAKELLMLGDPITGSDAADIGLINRAVPGDQLDAAVDGLADRLVAAAPLALAWTKLSLNTLLKQMVLGAFETSIAYDLLSMRTDDVAEAMRAFGEKRAPKFTGS